jgi:hypothetical protein
MAPPSGSRRSSVDRLFETDERSMKLPRVAHEDAPECDEKSAKSACMRWEAALPVPPAHRTEPFTFRTVTSGAVVRGYACDSAIARNLSWMWVNAVTTRGSKCLPDPSVMIATASACVIGGL